MLPSSRLVCLIRLEQEEVIEVSVGPVRRARRRQRSGPLAVPHIDLLKDFDPARETFGEFEATLIRVVVNQLPLLV